MWRSTFNGESVARDPLWLEGLDGFEQRRPTQLFSCTQRRAPLQRARLPDRWLDRHPMLIVEFS